MSESSIFEISSDAHVTSHDGRHFVTNVETGRVYELNATAREIIQALRKPMMVTELERHIAGVFPGGDAHDRRGDIEGLLGMLVDHGLAVKQVVEEGTA